ncbi:MAG: AsmA family protein [Nitrospirae bacterium]|nr:AsmA family protein [Nitrospirota bacterium]
MKKVLLITTSVIASVIIAFIIFIKIFITPERVKEYVVPVLEKSLNRKVEIGDISISLIRGIGINDFAVKEADQKADFVRCKEFVLKFKLLPLLSKRVVIDELRLVSPAVKIERGPDGKFNFEDIGQKKETEEIKEKSDEAGGLPVSLLVNNIAINDAGFSVTDMMKEIPDIKSSADINIGIKSYDGSEIITEGEIKIKADEIILHKPQEKIIKNITAGLKYAINANLKSKDIRIDRADLDFQDIRLSLTGKLNNLKISPEIDIALILQKTQAADIQKTASEFADIKNISLSGNLAADIKLNGEIKKPDTLKANGTVTMEELGIKYNEIHALLDGNIKFSEKTMNIDVRSTVNKNILEIKGSVRNCFKDQDINLNVYSKQLFIDQLIPAGKPEDKASAGSIQSAPGKTAKEPGPLDLKITANGEIRIDSAVYKNMTMSDFFMQFRFKDNKLEIPKLAAKAGKGTLNLNSLVDLSRPGYTYNLSGHIDSLHADEIVNTFFPKAKDTVFGIITFNLKMDGAGTLPENIKRNLAADADFNMKDGRITGANITKGLSRFLNIKELETINLRQAKGAVRIRNSIARLDSILSADDLSMDPKGDIGLDETLDLAFDLKLSPRLTDKIMSSNIGEYIKSEDGRGIVPLKISGTFKDPSYTVDVKKAGKRAVKKAADKYLDKLFDKKDEEKKKELEPVKDLLKGIFK